VFREEASGHEIVYIATDMGLDRSVGHFLCSGRMDLPLAYLLSHTQHAAASDAGKPQVSASFALSGFDGVDDDVLSLAQPQFAGLRDRQYADSAQTSAGNDLRCPAFPACDLENRPFQPHESKLTSGDRRGFCVRPPLPRHGLEHELHYRKGLDRGDGE
jgi:hypothetical protein